MIELANPHPFTYLLEIILVEHYLYLWLWYFLVKEQLWLDTLCVFSINRKYRKGATLGLYQGQLATDPRL